MSHQQGHGMYQTGSGYGMNGQTRDGVSAGYGFHSQKVGDKIPSLRNGVESYDRTIIRPTTTVTGTNATGEVTFDWTSANNRWWVPSQTLLSMQLSVGQAAAADDGTQAAGGINATRRTAVGTAALHEVTGVGNAVQANHLMFDTCPVSAMFRSMRLVCSGVTLEHQEFVHLASLLQLATETSPAMSATALQAGCQTYGEVGYAPMFGAAANTKNASQDTLFSLPLNPKVALLEAAAINAENGATASNRGITLSIPLPLNFASIQEFIPAARWQLVCEYDPNFHNKAVFSYGAVSHEGVDVAALGLDEGVALPEVVVRDVYLSVATVKPIIPKAISSAQYHVPSQSIQSVPVNTSGQYTLAVPASTYAVLAVFRPADVDQNPFIASTNFSMGQLVRNIRFQLGSTIFPTLDYNQKIAYGTNNDTDFFTADTHADNAQGSLTRARRGRALVSSYGIKPNATMDGARAYADFVDLVSKRYSPEGVMMDFQNWSMNPIYGARLMTPPGEIATSLRVTVDFLSDNVIDPSTNLYICSLHSKVASMAWSPASEYPSVTVENAS